MLTIARHDKDPEMIGLGEAAVVLTALGGWAREAWKGSNARRALDTAAKEAESKQILEAARQEAEAKNAATQAEVDQIIALAPAWKELVSHLETRCAGLETAAAADREAGDRKIEALRSEHNQQMEALRAQSLAQAVEYAVLKERVKHLEATLARTEAELAAAATKATADAQTIHRLLQLDQADLQYRIDTGTNQPDYTTMGGPPATDEATLQERPR